MYLFLYTCSTINSLNLLLVLVYLFRDPSSRFARGIPFSHPYMKLQFFYDQNHRVRIHFSKFTQKRSLYEVKYLQSSTSEHVSSNFAKLHLIDSTSNMSPLEVHFWRQPGRASRLTDILVHIPFFSTGHSNPQSYSLLYLRPLRFE